LFQESSFFFLNISILSTYLYPFSIVLKNKIGKEQKNGFLNIKIKYLISKKLTKTKTL
jgi:CO dehydrogenase/acetyl-CoA synthase beta subunit